MTQKEMIQDHLQRFGSITPAQALTEYACARLSARISELRKDGFVIETVDRKTVNRFGKKIKYTEKYILCRCLNCGLFDELTDVCIYWNKTQDQPRTHYCCLWQLQK